MGSITKENDQWHMPHRNVLIAVGFSTASKRIRAIKPPQQFMCFRKNNNVYDTIGI